MSQKVQTCLFNNRQARYYMHRMTKINQLTSETVMLEQERDRIFAKLMELGVNEKWLMEANFTREEMTQLLKGILYLKEMQT